MEQRNWKHKILFGDTACAGYVRGNGTGTCTDGTEHLYHPVLRRDGHSDFSPGDQEKRCLCFWAPALRLWVESWL